MDVRRAVQSVRGAGARSVKVHGIVVYLDKELTLPKPNSQARPAPTPAPEGALSAAAMATGRRADYIQAAPKLAPLATTH